MLRSTMLNSPSLQVLRPATRVAAAILMCSAACAAMAADPAISPLSGSYNPWADSTMVGQSRWSLGVVAEPSYAPPWSFVPDARNTSQTNLMVGMNLGQGSHAKFVAYAPLTQPRYNTLASDRSYRSQALDANGVPLPTPLRVGLVLTPSDPLKDLRQGALTKVELSGHMALSLRSNKGGGVWLALGGKW